MWEYLPEVLKGLHTSLTLTLAALVVALLLALLFTCILTLKIPVASQVVRGYITLFTGTPLLVQIFLIYYGPGQFPSIREIPWLWEVLSQPWLCAMFALGLFLVDNGSPAKRWACPENSRCVFCCPMLLSGRCRLIPMKWYWYSRAHLWPTPLR
jgi:His/Glu/Gln/Arg/opine family amino acid ABC transporter permease subunit